MVGGKVGTETLEQDQAGVGDSGKASKIVVGRFPREARGVGAHPEQGPQVGLDRVSRGRIRRGEASRGDEGRRGGTRPLRREGSRGRSPETAIRRWSASRSPVTPRTPAVEGHGRQDRRSDRQPPRRPTATSTSSSSGSGSSEEQFMEVFNKDLAQGDVRVAADHADPAGHRVRDAGRGGRPAAAGDHGHRGHHGPRRPAQPDRSG